MGLYSLLFSARRILNTIHENRFIKVANETMCRPIRALTEARGYATSKHTCVFLLHSSFVVLTRKTCSLASFGGAGGQHACEIASLLGIKTILIHRYSSILSAYGLALADRFVLPSPPSYLTSNSPFLCSYPAHTKSKNPARHFILPRTNQPSSLGSTG